MGSRQNRPATGETPAPTPDEEALRWQYYSSIPQKHWRKMSGRQAKVLNEQAVRYGIPFGGATVDLNEVARALHDFLAANAHRLARDEDEARAADTSALERWREARAQIAEIQRDTLLGTLVQRERMRAGLAVIAATLRRACETIERQFGVEAHEVVADALDESERQISALFGEDPPAARRTRKKKTARKRQTGKKTGGRRGTR